MGYSFSLGWIKLEEDMLESSCQHTDILVIVLCQGTEIKDTIPPQGFIVWEDKSQKIMSIKFWDGARHTLLQEGTLCTCVRMCVYICGGGWGIGCRAIAPLRFWAECASREPVKSQTANLLQGQEGALVGLHSLKTDSEVSGCLKQQAVYDARDLSTKTHWGAECMQSQEALSE